jgi:hypothetical protein
MPSGISSPPPSADAIGRAVADALVHVFSWKNAFSAAFLAASEYAMLSLIEDAPRAIKLATFIAPLAAFLTIQFEKRLRAVHVDLYPAVLVFICVSYVALGGYVYFLSPYREAAPPVAHSAILVADAPVAPTPPLSSYEAGKKLQAIDEFFAFLSNGVPSKVSDNAQRFRDWWTPFKDGTGGDYELAINTYLDGVRKVENDLNQLRSKNLEYPDLITTPPDMFVKISSSAESLRNAFHEANKYVPKSITQGELVVLIDPFSAQLQEKVGVYEGWRLAARTKLMQMRRQSSP